MGIKRIGLILLIAAIALAVTSCSSYLGRGRTGSGSEGDHPEALHISDPGHFKTEVQDYSGLVLVDFAAHWCAPCRASSPLVNRLAVEMEGKLKVVKVYSDEGETNQNIHKKYGVSAIPTFKIFRNGNEIASKTGGWPNYNQFKVWVEKNI